MSALEILANKWQLALALFLAFASGLAAGQIIFWINKEKAFNLVDWLDAKRKPFIQILYNLLKQPHGVVKSIGFIFGVNLLGASLLQHTLGGLLIAPPFVYLFIGGLLISLIVRRYPERLLITVIVAPFEFGAFVIAATGGVNMGLSLWGGKEIAIALQDWAVLFLVLVVPLQFLNGLLEGWLAHRLFISQKKPWG